MEVTWAVVTHGLRTPSCGLHVLFRDADTLGSLIDPRRELRGHAIRQGFSHRFEDVDWDEIAPLLLATRRS